ncbi:MAG: InlB B-repeat-containing protein [Gemmatimonadales bacterium]|jgi:uncharacterized repeat protein (TIGR02543 family)|nr:InlB B-repeat-containing protein [Gemmatimonadales bacterium]
MKCSRPAAAGALLSLLVCVASCGGGGGTTAEVTSVQVAPATASVAVGATATFTATANDQNGQVVAGVAFTWRSTNPAVATVANGVVTGVSEGQAGIEASTAGVTGQAEVTVTAGSMEHSLSVMVSGSGRVASSPAGIDCGTTCQATYAAGTQVTLTATPAANYAFAGWGGDCSGTGACNVTMSAARSVTATFTPTGTQHQLTVGVTGSGTVTSSPAGIDCGSTCQASFDAGTAVTLTATPGSNHVFAGWGGACSGTGTCSVTMTGAVSVTALFTPTGTQYQLAVNVTGSGTVTSAPSGIDCGSTCQASFDAGTAVTLTATPGSNYAFAGWGGACSGTGACNVTMNGALSVTASFTPTGTQHQLAVNVTGSGTVTSAPSGIDCGSTCQAAFASGTAVTLTATPASNYTFTGWSGDCTGTGTCSVTMNGSRLVTATFTLVHHQLTVTVTGTGTVTSNPSGIDCGSTCQASFGMGTPVTLTATPAGGQQLTGWGGACSGTGSCIVTMDAAKTVTATFAAIQHQLTVTATGGGAVTSNPAGIDCGATCTASFDDGAYVTLTPTPTAEHEFVEWTGDCTGSGGCSLTMDQAHTVGATFRLVQHSLSVYTSGEGTVTSAPAGISCPGTCSASYDSGTGVALTASPATGWLFTSWSGDCSGSATCNVTMSTTRSVSAEFSGPFNFSVASDVPACSFSMLPHESREIHVGVTLTAGAALPVDLTVTGLPSGVSGAFAPTQVTPNGSSVLTLTSNGAALGETTITITGTNGTTVHSFDVVLDIRSPYAVVQGQGVAIEAGGATALVTERAGWCDRLVRVDAATKEVLETITSGLDTPSDLVIESGGTTALVAHRTGVVRVALATGAVTSVAALNAPYGIALESSGATALVGDCGATDCGTTGRLVRVDVTTGAVTPITPTSLGLKNPRSIALEPSGTGVVMIEGDFWNDRLIRINLATGGVVALATGFTGAQSVALDGTGDAIITGPGWTRGFMSRVTLASGTKTLLLDITQPYSNLFGVAVESGGTSALVVNRGTDGRLMRVDLRRRDRTAAPSRQSGTILYQPTGVAVESGGTSALVTDCGPTDCRTTGRLVRVDLATGNVTAITTAALDKPVGVAIEAGGATALVLETPDFGGRLVRVTLADGTMSVVATGWMGALQLAIEPGGATVLVAGGGWNDPWIGRVTLATGAWTTLYHVGGCCHPLFDALSMEPSGTTALVVAKSAPGTLYRLNLSTNALTPIAGDLAYPFGVFAEPDGQHALVAEGGPYPYDTRLLRVDLATGRFMVLATALGGLPRGFAAAGTIGLLTEGDRLVRIDLSSPSGPTTVTQGFDKPTGLALEPGEATALFVECGALVAGSWGTWGSPNCLSTARMWRVDLTTGARTLIAAGLNQPAGLVVESGGTTALMTDCGPSGVDDCANQGRLVRVTLATGAVSIITTGLNQPDGLALGTGTLVYVTERGAGRVLLVDTSDGSFVPVASGLETPRQVVVESGGTTALVATTSGIRRLDLSTHETEVVSAWPVVRFAVQPGGGSALVMTLGTGVGAPLVRTNLVTGGIDIPSPSRFDTPHTLLLTASGATGLYDETRPLVGGVFLLTPP